MDWKLTVALVMAVVALFMGMRYRKLRKDVDKFAGQMEQSFDAIVEGESEAEVLEDSLFAKLQEKLLRTNHIFALREQKNEKEREQLQSLISDIAHQSRIPLANQKIYLDLLAEEAHSEEGMQALDSLAHQTGRLQFLMESMIKLSRMESGIIQIRKKPQDLMETIRKAVAGIVVEASKKNQQLSVDGPTQLTVMHDAKWTTEAIGNVLENAVKYTDEDGQALLYQNRNRSMPFLLRVERDLYWQGVSCYPFARRYASAPLCQQLIGYLGASACEIVK